MATLVASASASSLYSSVQPEDSDVFNDPLSYSNQTLLEKRRSSATVVPKHDYDARSLSIHNEGYDSEDSNLLIEHGLLLRTLNMIQVFNYIFLCFFFF